MLIDSSSTYEDLIAIRKKSQFIISIARIWGNDCRWRYHKLFRKVP